MPPAMAKALLEPLRSLRRGVSVPRPGSRSPCHANPFPKTRVMGSEWVRHFVLGSRPTPEDQKPLENKCRRWDLNPHALAGTGF